MLARDAARCTQQEGNGRSRKCVKTVMCSFVSFFRVECGEGLRKEGVDGLSRRNGRGEDEESARIEGGESAA